MVFPSDSYLQNLEKHTIEFALMFGLGPKTFRRYVDLLPQFIMILMPNLGVEIMLLKF